MEIKIESSIPIAEGKGSAEFKKILRAMKKMARKQSFFIGKQDMDCRRVRYAVHQCKKSLREIKTMKNREYTTKCMVDGRGNVIGARVWRIY